MLDRERLADGGRAPLRLASALLSGLLVGLAFPEPAIRAVAWVGLVPMFVALRDARPVTAAGIGLLYAFGVSLVAGTWFPEGVIRYFDQSPSVALIVYVATIVLTGGLCYAVFGLFWVIARRAVCASPARRTLHSTHRAPSPPPPERCG